MSVAPAALLNLDHVAGRLARSDRPIRHVAAVGVALVLGVLAVPVSERAAAGLGLQSCRIEPAAPRFGEDSETTILTFHGTACSVLLRPMNATIDALAIVSPPVHGALRIRGRTGVVYRPASGFTGEDSFAFRVSGHDGGTLRTATVRARVRVQ